MCPVCCNSARGHIETTSLRLCGTRNPSGSPCGMKMRTLYAWVEKRGCAIGGQDCSADTRIYGPRRQWCSAGRLPSETPRVSGGRAQFRRRSRVAKPDEVAFLNLIPGGVVRGCLQLAGPIIRSSPFPSGCRGLTHGGAGPCVETLGRMGGELPNVRHCFHEASSEPFFQ